MKSTALLPRARIEGLVIHELDDETLVYDRESYEALCLNKTASLVWKRCDGETTVAKMAGVLQKEFHTSVDNDLVWLTIKHLQRYRLIESGDRSPVAPSVSRRKLLLKYAPAALALPVIMSISAPTPAVAASCAGASRPIGCPCSNDNDCESFNCNEGVCGPGL